MIGQVTIERDADTTNVHSSADVDEATADSAQDDLGIDADMLSDDPMSRPLTILVVDDDPTEVILVKAFFNRPGL